MSDDKSAGKVWQHESGSILRKGMISGRRQQPFEKQQRLVWSLAHRLMKTKLSVRCGFLDTHQWWISQAFQSKKRKCPMTQKFPVLKERDESKHDSHILTLSDQELRWATQPPPPHSTGHKIWLSAIAHLELPTWPIPDFFPISVDLISWLDLTLWTPFSFLKHYFHSLVFS